MSLQNPFENSEIAERYHSFRPQYHHIPCQKLADTIGDGGLVLDVACGTGHSTDALSKYFEDVNGCDISEAMLEVARKNYELDFVKSDGSVLPFEDSSLSLVTVFMGFHWLDQKIFLQEAYRVLVEGHLALDNFGFSGHMTNNEEFYPYHTKFYKENFPHVSRNKDFLADEEMTGFQNVLSFEYEHLVDMKLEDFIGLLLSQSNLILSTKHQQADLPDILKDAYSPFFEERTRKMKFTGLMKLYKKKA